jgi:hypothetical protein
MPLLQSRCADPDLDLSYVYQKSSCACHTVCLHVIQVEHKRMLGAISVQRRWRAHLARLNEDRRKAREAMQGEHVDSQNSVQEQPEVRISRPGTATTNSRPGASQNHRRVDSLRRPSSSRTNI